MTLRAFHTLEVGPNGVLNISGNLTQTAEVTANIVVNGGELKVQGNLLLPSGRSSAKTIMNVDIRNGGSFEVTGVTDAFGTITGGKLDVKNDATLNLTGDADAQSSLLVKSFEFGQRSTINIADGGGLIVEGLTDYTGNNSSINVNGFFRTGGVLIRGGAGNQLNTFGNAEVVIDNDLDVRGNSEITFGGNSLVDIGGDVRVEGGSVVTATNTAQIFVCGSYPDPSDSKSGAVELIDGQFNSSCRILPVDFAGFDAKFDGQTNAVNLTWSTAKEWNNSHFEIERSIGGIADFKKIGEVAGKGWSDDLSNYAHVDNTLPNGKAIAYYRIRQVDFDGKSSISKVISIQTQVVNETKSAWQAYPNPVRDNQINIKLLDYSAFSGENIQARIVHANMMVASQELGSVEELNAFLQQQISRIPKGVFVIEIKWADKIEHLKMLKAL
ncbi:hypothetical protein [Mariniradius saccharolyticus]|uniref:hypothetical protein n=1 Tax=Mariniradius saccharolyticus TaxID=1245591 RepID=UPI00031405A7|nr:hypothetical protein [Mariniradius saccharolyticus]